MAGRDWVMVAVVIVFLLLIGLATTVAVLHHRDRTADRAYRVLRLLMTVLTGSVISGAVALHQAGLL
jgi:hypothetical protein